MPFPGCLMSRLQQMKAIVSGQMMPLKSPDPLQRPLLYYPGLTQAHFHDVSQFPWVSDLRRACADITEEVDHCLARRIGFEPIFPSYTSQGRWAGLWFHLYGIRYEENCRAFPKTIRAIERVPQLAGWAALSALEPGSHVRPHCGVTNAKLRLHYAIRTEPGSRMRIAGATYEWKPGDIMIFDDSYEHEVWVCGTKPRIVLIIDFYHPDLTAEEIDFLKSWEAEPSIFLRGESLRSASQKRDPKRVEAESLEWVYA